jgi:hypothetical protein
MKSNVTKEALEKTVKHTAGIVELHADVLDQVSGAGGDTIVLPIDGIGQPPVYPIGPKIPLPGEGVIRPIGPRFPIESK